METHDGIRLRDFAHEVIAPSNTQDPQCESTSQNHDGPPNFWSKHIRLTVSEDSWRDHLALERTYLAYVRTASAYAQFGILLAQLFRLNVSSIGESTPMSLRIGSALGATTEGIAIVVLLMGAVYWARQQRRLVEGTTIAERWLSLVMVGMSGIVSMACCSLEANADYVLCSCSLLYLRCS